MEVARSAPRIALLFAVRAELGPLQRTLKPSHQAGPSLRQCAAVFGRRGATTVCAAAGGVGARRAALAAEELLRSWQPDLIVMTGVAGALVDMLAVGDIVIAESVEAEGERLVPPLIPCEPPIAPLSAPPDAKPPRCFRGALLSLDRVLVTSEEKRSVVTPGVLAIEMETAGLARAARRQAVPWAAVRAISDTVDESLPLDFNRLRDAGGDLPVSRVALAALRQPSSVRGLLRLARNTNAAAESLAAFLGPWLDAAPDWIGVQGSGLSTDDPTSAG